ncbi:universal stress protein [Mycobacterium sp. URHB0044]|jgi:nucleotide-binding universal stress UspA family protein|uniref:universal stress protein n=1 Tax=Mycobacterium sp. URHB0044 TaxID=1380386 RepID=UPI00048CFE4F|nr:universal stress protein [Mycobacterium sp. URHB0044]
MRNIVVLVNERPESRAALQWALNASTALRMTGGGSGELTLHVVLGPSTDIPGGPRYVSPTLVDEITAQLRGTAVSHEIHSRSADPAHGVIELAEDVNADLVVIGMQKRSPTLKLFMGSHTRDILVDAPCPVVSVKE